MEPPNHIGSMAATKMTIIAERDAVRESGLSVHCVSTRMLEMTDPDKSREDPGNAI